MKKLFVLMVGLVFGIGFVLASTSVTDLQLITTGNVTAANYCNSTTCYSLSDFLASGSGDNSSWNESYASTIFVSKLSGDTLIGQYDFNGGWTSDGLSIIGGNLYVQNISVLNGTSVNLVDSVTNASLLPEITNSFDLGNATYKWKNGIFSNDVNATTFYGNLDWSYVQNSPTSNSYFTNGFGFYNSTDFVITDYLLLSNTTLKGNYSASVDFCVDGGSCLSGLTAARGIVWAEATNGTLVELSTVLGFGYYNSTTLPPAGSEVDPYWAGNFSLYNSSWSLDADTTYSHLSNFTNDLGYYNSTDFFISNYYLNSNPYSFYNSTTLPISPETNWNANYSIFLTQINWANAINGTLALSSEIPTDNSELLNGFGYYNSTNPSPVINTSYYL